jgi:hypothetical protein
MLGLTLECLPGLRRSSLRIVLDNVRSAFNTGALFRTADAACVEMIYLLGFTPHPPRLNWRRRPWELPNMYPGSV